MKRLLWFATLFTLFLLHSPALSQSDIITPDNADNLTLQQTLGRGALLQAQLIENETKVAALSAGGITIYEASNLAEVQHIAFSENYVGLLRGAAFISSFANMRYQDNVFTLTLPTRSAGGEGQTITVSVNAETGEQSAQPPLEIPTNAIISPDGQLQVMIPAPDTREVSITLVNAGDGAESVLLQPQTGIMLDADFSPEGDYFTAAYLAEGIPTRLQVWDTASGENVSMLDLEERAHSAVIAENVLAVETRDESIVVYSLPDLEIISTLEQGALVSANDGRLIYQETGTSDGESAYVIYDLNAGAEISRIPGAVCYEVGLNSLATADTLYTYYAVADGFIRAYDLTTGEVRGRAGGFGRLPGELAVAGDTLFVGSGNVRPESCAQTDPGNGVQAYDLAAGQETAFYPSQFGAVTRVAYDATNDRLAVARARGVDIFQGGELVTSIEREDYPFFLEGVAFSGAGEYFALSANETVYVWPGDNLAGDPVLMREGLTRLNWDSNIAFWNSTLISVSGQDIQLYDVANDREITALAQPGTIMDIDIQGETLAVLSGSSFTGETPTVSLYSLSDAGAEVTTTFPVTGEYLASIALNPDASLVALAQPNGDVRYPGTIIYHTATGTLVGEIGPLVLPLIFSADGSRLIGANGYSISVYGIG